MRLVVFGALLVLSGCAGEPTCGLEGDYLGAFSGGEQGSIELLVVPGDEDGQGVVDVHLLNSELDLRGESPVTCSLGSFVTRLEDAAGAEVGEALGSLGTLHGSGTWSLFTGVRGVWQY